MARCTPVWHILTMSHSNAVVVLALGALVACSGKDSGPTASKGPAPFTNIPAPSGGVAQFTVIPVAPVPGLSLTALGNLNPPGHTVPTDHVYFYSWDLSNRFPPTPTGTRAVYMPATGAAMLVLHQSGAEYKIMYRVTENFYFYLDHMVPSFVPKVGDIVTAGTQIGTTSPGGGLDLGAFDMSVTLNGFISPARYAEQSLHVVSPWKYFTPTLQAQLYPQVYRSPTASDKDGRIDFSIEGKLVGDWYLQGMPVDSSRGSYGWSRSLAFVYDYYDPTSVRISFGGITGQAGVWAIESSAPRPETVSVASGVVSYKLYSGFDIGFPSQGVLLVQMINDSTIKVEQFMGTSVGTPQFDASAWTFVR
jgi:hypothetical protein